MIRLGNNEVLKTLMKTLTFVDTDADVRGSTIALCGCCSGELKIRNDWRRLQINFFLRVQKQK